jgi:hypothetical protein
MADDGFGQRAVQWGKLSHMNISDQFDDNMMNYCEWLSQVEASDSRSQLICGRNSVMINPQRRFRIRNQAVQVFGNFAE